MAQADFRVLGGPAPGAGVAQDVLDEVLIGVAIGHVDDARDAVGLKVIEGLALLGRHVGLGHVLAGAEEHGSEKQQGSGKNRGTEGHRKVNYSEPKRFPEARRRNPPERKNCLA